jgi:hypothetical protein
MPTLVDFQEYLTEQLKNPDFRDGLELEERKVNLQVLINDVLQKTGNETFRVEVLGMDEY